MPTDREIMDMLDARASRATTSGLLSDARLVALAAGRSGIRGGPWIVAPALIASAIAVLFAIAVIPNWDRRPSASSVGSAGTPAAPVDASSRAPGADASIPPPSPEAAEVICAIEEDTCDKSVAILRTSAPELFASERVVIGPAVSQCPPGAFCRFELPFSTLAVGARTGWSTLDDLGFVAVTGGSLPESAKVIERSTIPLATLRWLPNPAIPAPDGEISWTVEQLNRRPISDPPGTIIVNGWLSATPPIECRGRPLLSNSLDFGCNEQDWLTDAEFQPWRDRSTRIPVGGIRVPNGSYDRFAPWPSPSRKAVARTPRLGSYLVRATLGAVCQRVVPPSSVPCTGPLGWIYEIVDRISP